MLALSAAGVALAGAGSYVVQRNRVDTRIDAALAQEVAEFRTLAETGVDPRTGQRLASIEDLFYVALLRNVPDAEEGILTLVEGEVAYYSPGGRAVQLELLPEVVDAVRGLRTQDGVRLDTVDTAIGQVRYAAVPVSVEDEERAGVYVVGIARQLAQAQTVDSARIFAVIAALALVVVALVSWFVAGRLLAPVRTLRETAQRISETDLGERITVTGHDDISDLARTFNGMLDRLESAFSVQRQLLDDVGHELRTPITIVRGHLELLDGADAEEVEETRGLVLDELDRMNRMVDDLLLLAKARRPDFLRWSDLDVAPLVDEVMDKARGLAERDWRLDARAEVTVAGDPQRLTQALLQLAANAVRYTDPGDVVAFGSAATDTEVRIWVRDTGPGIPADDRERIFTRFARGRGARDADGSGLGLPIVAAIAEAHGGRVELASEPGAGAVFAVALPRPVSSVAEPDGGDDAAAADTLEIPVRRSVRVDEAIRAGDTLGPGEAGRDRTEVPERGAARHRAEADG